jgi:excisionase family DNA binding protein
MLTLKEAADAVGLTKPALLKAIQKGRLSATRDDKNQWQIDPAELFRVYQSPKTEDENQTEKGFQKEMDGLRRELHLKDDRIDDLKAQLADLRTDRDQWRDQARIALLACHPKPEPEARPAPPPEPQQATNQNQRRPFWAAFKGWALAGLVVLLVIIAALAGALAASSLGLLWKQPG